MKIRHKQSGVELEGVRERWAFIMERKVGGGRGIQ